MLPTGSHWEGYATEIQIKDEAVAGGMVAGSN